MRINAGFKKKDLFPIFEIVIVMYLLTAILHLLLSITIISDTSDIYSLVNWYSLNPKIAHTQTL